MSVIDAVFAAGPLGLSVDDSLTVVRVVEGGQAEKAGVCVGCRLLGLNKEALTRLPHAEALGRIKSAGRPLTLSFSAPASSSAATNSARPLPGSQPVQPPQPPVIGSGKVTTWAWL